MEAYLGGHRKSFQNSLAKLSFYSRNNNFANFKASVLLELFEVLYVNLRINRKTLQILFSVQASVMHLNAIIEKIISCEHSAGTIACCGLTLAVSCVLSLRKGKTFV